MLFVDEAHRFNKSQQDAFLPHVENGTVIFIGATTENPSFELNNALLSRARVYVLEALGEEAVEDGDRPGARRRRARTRRPERLRWRRQLRRILAGAVDGDARRALNLLEIASDLVSDDFPRPDRGGAAARARRRLGRRFDKGGDAFYDQISALHKSIRGSNPDGALYWLARMLDGGCDPRYLARRLVRIASEDIGNADPRALALGLDAWEVQERLGSPEGELALAHAAVYMACAPKSNAVYTAFGAAMRDAREHGSLEVPKHLRNAPTRLLESLGHGEGYRYAHDEPDAYAAGERYLPDALQQRRYYEPTGRGLEGRIAEKLRELRALDEAARTKPRRTASDGNPAAARPHHARSGTSQA